MPLSTADIDLVPSAYLKSAGMEPLPGYTLLEPLGRGGFGEVWKCEAPGGLHKAIKFVAGANGADAAKSNQFQQEFDAFLQIKSIRHPFLLTLERVELVGGDLVMVMELADRQLGDRFDECRAACLPGIPRQELIGYLAEAAEALDLISTDYGLQHLDVKPANLFITAGHVKVGDYGLVSRLDGANAAGNRGLTPKFVAPEVLRGQMDPRSDQYSLALVYHELLTGAFPYAARTPQQMMLAHVSAKPDLSSLPECDRPVLAIALAKKPEERFASCQEFARALHVADRRSAASRPGSRAYSLATTPGPAERTGRHPAPRGSGTVAYALRGPNDAVTENNADSSAPTLPAGNLATNRWPDGTLPPAKSLVPQPAEDLPLAEPVSAVRIRVSPIRSVVPVARLRGESAPSAVASATEVAAAIATAAAAGGHVPQLPGDFGRLADGSWVCQFPTTVPGVVAPHKLSVVRDRWDMTVDASDAERIVFRKAATGGLWSAFSGRRAGGLELVVRMPKTGQAVGEATATATVAGNVDQAFLRSAQSAIPKMLEDVRRELGNVADRRKSPRIAAAFPLVVHPLHSDGRVDPAVAGQCRDASAGGLCFATREPIATRYAYVEFAGVNAIAGLAVLMKLTRSQVQPSGAGHIYAGPYRLDL